MINRRENAHTNNRVRPTEAHEGDCEICGMRTVCYFIDLDFRGASICREDSAFVLGAEEFLKASGLEIPTVSNFGDSIP
jgi:hypothetical protein